MSTSTRTLSARVLRCWKVLDWPDIETVQQNLIDAAIVAGFATVRGELPPPDRLIQSPLRMLEVCRTVRLSMGSPAAPEWIICYSYFELRKAGLWILQDCGDFTKSKDWASTVASSGWKKTASELCEFLLDCFQLFCPEINDEQLGCNPSKAKAFLMAFGEVAEVSLDPMADWPAVMRQLQNARKRSDKRACQSR